jgi:hypothetical protein
MIPLCVAGQKHVHIFVSTSASDTALANTCSKIQTTTYDRLVVLHGSVRFSNNPLTMTCTQQPPGLQVTVFEVLSRHFPIQPFSPNMTLVYLLSLSCAEPERIPKYLLVHKSYVISVGALQWPISLHDFRLHPRKDPSRETTVRVSSKPQYPILGKCKASHLINTDVSVSSLCTRNTLV